MKRTRIIHFLQVLTGAATLTLAGCSANQHEDHAHNGEESHGHEHGEESPSGASFKEGKGVILVDETRKSIGLEIVDVTEKVIPPTIPMTFQVFAERHSHTQQADDHSRCEVEASGFLDSTRAAQISRGTVVSLTTEKGGALTGQVKDVHKALALGESEIVITISNSIPHLTSQSFHRATLELPQTNPLPTIPRSALLQTPEGQFVYTVNGDAYYRTPIKLAAESKDWISVADGLLAGDQVVTHPVQTLWLVELRATKGGGHSH